jgi:hypothetical protein
MLQIDTEFEPESAVDWHIGDIVSASKRRNYLFWQISDIITIAFSSPQKNPMMENIKQENLKSEKYSPQKSPQQNLQNLRRKREIQYGKKNRIHDKNRRNDDKRSPFSPRGSPSEIRIKESEYTRCNDCKLNSECSDNIFMGTCCYEHSHRGLNVNRTPVILGDLSCKSCSVYNYPVLPGDSCKSSSVHSTPVI